MTAYEMRISDWSSDVCSSDLAAARGVDDVGIDPVDVLGFDLEASACAGQEVGQEDVARANEFLQNGSRFGHLERKTDTALSPVRAVDRRSKQIGRASCRERVCQYG